MAGSSPAADRRVPRIALVGNPNTGKTTLFNRLCGARAKTSNFPGTTTSMRVGRHARPDGSSWEVVDLPGLYGLRVDGPESRIVKGALDGSKGALPDALVVIVDATNLARNLVLVGEVLGIPSPTPVPIVIALNMVDLAQRRGVSIDAAPLALALGVPVVPIVASKGEGVAGLANQVADAMSRGPALDPTAHDAIRAAVTSAASKDTLDDWADKVVEAAGGVPHVSSDPFTERLDRILTHPLLGTLAFLLVMGGLFWTLYSLATLPMDLIEATFSALGQLVSTYLPPGPIADLVANGIIGGIAGTIVFLPQICLLFFLISLLEDTGYLARAAFVNDRFFRRFGLPGHAFVPLLTSHACALPGIMSTRLIPSRRDRIVTILVAPFISCSARLPVYVLLTSLLFAGHPAWAGVAFASCYLLGAGAAFTSAWLFGRTVYRGEPRAMVLELPTYKRPSLRTAFLTAKDQGEAFLRTAGTVIVAICIVMWWLSAYPRVAPTPQAEALRAQGAVAEADAVQAQAQQEGSIIGHLGRFVEPAFRPLGYDWQLSVGLLTSFLAREVFVSTMSVLAGGAGEPDDEGVRLRIRSMTRADGRPVFTQATAASALVFFVLAMQCLPTLAVTRREAGGLRFAVLQLGYMSTVAWVMAFVVFQTLRLMGVS